MTVNTNCPSYQKCSAPICPLDSTTIDKAIWFPSEDICHIRNTLQWVKTQRKISKVKAPTDRYFTLAMLESINRVQKGISGISPEQNTNKLKEVERTWITSRQHQNKLKKAIGVPNSIANERENKSDVNKYILEKKENAYDI